MHHVFKISINNRGMKSAPPLYFETKEAAETYVEAINKAVVTGKKIQWKAEIIEVLSKKDAGIKLRESFAELNIKPQQ